MIAPVPLRDIPQTNIFRKGDVFVLFGELFGRGYANGLINEARKAGMTDAMFAELMAVVGMANETNRLASGYQVEIDQPFKT